MTLARWQNSIEQIMLAAVRPQERILGLTSLRPGAGVSLVCHHIARTAAAGEFKTLLLDISEPHTPDGPVRTWRPGHDKISNLITPTVGRYDYLKIRTDEATRPLFCNPAKLRSVYRTELEQYALVVVDLPPLLEPSELGPNPVAAAGSCDQVLLLCAVGRDTRSELADAISLVGGAGGKLAGLVSNEYLYEQPLEQIGRLAGTLHGRLSPLPWNQR
jgi:Mrp family chromosome partitioning ATPase